MIESSTCHRALRAAGTRSGGGTSGMAGPLPAVGQVPVAEGGVHGEDLGVADRADGPGLGDWWPRTATVTSMSMTAGGRA